MSSYSKYMYYMKTVMTAHEIKLLHTSASSHFVWCARPTPHTSIITEYLEKKQETDFFPFVVLVLLIFFFNFADFCDFAEKYIA